MRFIDGKKGPVVGPLVLLFVLAAGVPAALAQLERVGPVSPAHGFPAWYQDNTGLALEFCQPQTPVELADGWCLLLAADTTVPEVFPSRFADEHFYWAADALLDDPISGVSAGLVLGLEAAFAQGPVIAGDQVVFGRIRVRIDNPPATGDYTIYHPFGTWTVPGTAGQRIFVTEDIGFNCPPGQFDCALGSNVWPFLLPSLTPGGPELPAVNGPAGKYIADPAGVYNVTGSRVGQNYFRIVGPAGSGLDIQTDQFTLMGRIHTGLIPGRVKAERASYTRPAGAAPHVDVFASGAPSTAGRLPGGTRPPSISPVLAFYAAGCAVDAATGALTEPVGLTAVQMFNDGGRYWGQAALAAADSPIPTAVCIEDYTGRDINGQVVSAFYNLAVADQVTINQAAFSAPNGGSLTVQAISSDALLPALTLLPYAGAMLGGSFTRTPTAAPAETVRVRSDAGGIAALKVTAVAGLPGGGGFPIAVAEAYTIAEDSVANIWPVLDNDTVGGVVIGTGGGTVSIVVAPRLGTAVANADGTITFTPSLNANGTDGLAYVVNVGGLSSTAAYVTINITPVNDAPVAANDTTSGVTGGIISIPVLANDTDIDGAADLASALVSQPASGATAAWDPVTRVVTLTGAAAGTHTFSYQAVDAAGALSNTATVTVTVTQLETITITRVEYIASKLRWRIAGTSSVRGGQLMTFTYANGFTASGVPLNGYLLGTIQVDATGAFLWDFPVPSRTDLRNVGNASLFFARPTRIRATSALGGTQTATISIK